MTPRGQNGAPIVDAIRILGNADPVSPAQADAPRTEDITEAMRERFPAVFSGAPKPLKLRIQADIRERAPGVFSKAALSAFLRRHTGRTGYLIALTRATHRFDLDGAPAGEISAEHRQAAADELARRRALRQEREAQAALEQRRRAELLRAYQVTPLNKANFCALKGIPVDALDGLLAQARREAEERLPAARDAHALRGPRHHRAPRR